MKSVQWFLRGRWKCENFDNDRRWTHFDQKSLRLKWAKKLKQLALEFSGRNYKCKHYKKTKHDAGWRPTAWVAMRLPLAFSTLEVCNVIYNYMNCVNVKSVLNKTSKLICTYIKNTSLYTPVKVGHKGIEKASSHQSKPVIGSHYFFCSSFSKSPGFAFDSLLHNLPPAIIWIPKVSRCYLIRQFYLFHWLFRI